MKKIQDGSASFFIICVVILTLVSVFSIWKVLSKDVITKSFETVLLMLVVSVIVSVAGKYFDSDKNIVTNPDGSTTQTPEVISPMFSKIRYTTVGLLIVSVTLSALLGVLSIWEVMSKNVLDKSLSSIAVIAFSALVVITTCLMREHKISPYFSKISTGKLIFYIILAVIFIPIIVAILIGAITGLQS